MFVIENTLLSDDIFAVAFVCDLARCKGNCCVAGDGGAPLEPQEAALVETLYPTIQAYMTEQGIRAIEEQGVWIAEDGLQIAPLVNGGACAYANFDQQGVAYCAMQRAFEEGKTDFPKPISCHLYPIRIHSRDNGMDRLEYEQWSICKAACKLGKQLQVPLYKFLKTPLIRKYGEAYYEALVAAAERYYNNEKRTK